MQRSATFISVVFHPLFMPLACVVVACEFDWYVKGMMTGGLAGIVYFIVALSTIGFPLINLLLLRWYGVVSSLHLPERKERTAPYISTIFFFALGYYMLRRGELPDALFSILFGSILVLTMVTLLNLKWKVSAHSAGIFGVLGSLIALFKIHDFFNISLVSLVILSCGLVLSSRLFLHAHKPAQVYAGAAIGFIAMYLPVILGVYI